MLLFECELINLVYHESRESFFTIGCGIYLFACYQLFHAAKPDTCCRLLSIKNNTEHPLADLKVFLTLEPEFASVSPVMVEKLASGEIITITGLNLMLDPSFYSANRTLVRYYRSGSF